MASSDDCGCPPPNSNIIPPGAVISTDIFGCTYYTLPNGTVVLIQCPDSPGPGPTPPPPNPCNCPDISVIGTLNRIVVTEPVPHIFKVDISPAFSPGGGGGSLTATYIGYGDGSNLLTGDGNLIWDSATQIMTVNGSGIFGDIGGVYNYAMGSGVGTLGFNSFGYLAGVTGYGALMQLSPSTGTFSMFLESNVSAGNAHAHTKTLEWDNTGNVYIPIKLGVRTSSPSTALDVAGITSSADILTLQSVGTGVPSIEAGLVFKGWVNNFQGTNTGRIYAFWDGTSSGTDNRLSAQTWNGAAWNDIWSIKNGMMGVGITTPTAKLDIIGINTTSATYGLKVSNLTPTLNFYVRDDGAVNSRLGYWITDSGGDNRITFVLTAFGV